LKIKQDEESYIRRGAEFVDVPSTIRMIKAMKWMAHLACMERDEKYIHFSPKTRMKKDTWETYE
jgi:hypothetical protein